MASAKKVVANRRNARRSTGPRTAEGKAASARNALRHGILSRSPVIPEVESEAEWQEHLNAVASALAPEGYMEHTLARRIALQTWRLERVRRYETAIAAARIEGIAPEETGALRNVADELLDEFLAAARDRDAYQAVTKMKPYETVPKTLVARVLTRIASVNRLVFREGAFDGNVGDRDDGEAEEEVRFPASEVVRLANEIGERGGVPPEQALALERLQAHRLGGNVPAPVAVDVTVEAGAGAR